MELETMILKNICRIVLFAGIVACCGCEMVSHTDVRCQDGFKLDNADVWPISYNSTTFKWGDKDGSLHTRSINGCEFVDHS